MIPLECAIPPATSSVSWLNETRLAVFAKSLKKGDKTLMDPLALSTTVLSAGVLAASSAGGAWGKLRARTTSEASRTGFYLLSPAQHLWRSSPGRTINASVLCEGAGILLPDATLHYPPAPTWISSLRGSSQAQRCLVTIPASASVRFRHAAAGCGVVAVAAPNEHDSAVNPGASTPLPEIPGEIAVPTEPGWFLGLNGYSREVELFPVPGSTIVLSGPLPLIQVVLHQLRWLPGLFTVVGAQNEGQISELESQWRAAWDPNRTRIVVTPPQAAPPSILAAADAAVELATESNQSVLYQPGQNSSTEGSVPGDGRMHFSVRHNGASSFRSV